jgi:hypothetical protein
MSPDYHNLVLARSCLRSEIWMDQGGEGLITYECLRRWLFTHSSDA